MSDKHQDKMTTERGFTAGEWRPVRNTANSYMQDVDILREDGLALAVAVHNWDITPAEALANATLIAQAPALVEALEECVMALENGLESDEGELEAPGSKSDRLTVARARTVISRALGRGE